MAGLRIPRLRDRRRGRHQDPRAHPDRSRGVRTGRQHDRERSSGARLGDGADPERRSDGRRSLLPRRDGGRAAAAGGPASHPELREPAHPGEREPDLRRRALGASPLPDRRQRHRGHGPGQAGHRRRPTPRRRRIPGFTVGEFGDASTSAADQRQGPVGLRQGADHVPAGHADHPADRLRRTRRCRGAAAPGADGRLRHDRPPRADQPPHRRGRQLDQRGGPPDRSGRRGWTTRCSICAASARSAKPVEARRRRWRPRRRPPAAR